MTERTPAKTAELVEAGKKKLEEFKRKKAALSQGNSRGSTPTPSALSSSDARLSKSPTPDTRQAPPSSSISSASSSIPLSLSKLPAPSPWLPSHPSSATSTPVSKIALASNDNSSFNSKFQDGASQKPPQFQLQSNMLRNQPQSAQNSPPVSSSSAGNSSAGNSVLTKPLGGLQFSAPFPGQVPIQNPSLPPQTLVQASNPVSQRVSSLSPRMPDKPPPIVFSSSNLNSNSRQSTSSSDSASALPSTKGPAHSAIEPPPTVPPGQPSSSSVFPVSVKKSPSQKAFPNGFANQPDAYTIRRSESSDVRALGASPQTNIDSKQADAFLQELQAKDEIISRLQAERGDADGHWRHLLQAETDERNKLEERHRQEVSELQEKLSGLRSRIESLEQDCKKSAQEAKKAAERVKELTAINERFEEAKNRARLELKDSRHEVEQLHEEHAQMALRLSSQDKMIEQLLEEKNYLTTELDRCNRVLGELENEKNAMDTSIRKQTEVIQRLMVEKDEMEARVHVKQSEVLALQDEVQDLRKALETGERGSRGGGDDLTDWVTRELMQSDKLVKEKKELETLYSQQKRLVQELGEENSQLMAQLAEQSRASGSLVEDNFALKEKCKALQRNLDGLLQQRGASGTISSSQSLPAGMTFDEMASLKDERDRLAVLVESLRAQGAGQGVSGAGDHGEVQRNLAAKEEEVRALREYIGQLQGHCTAMQEAFGQVQGRCQALEMQLAESVSTLDKARKHNDVLAESMQQQEQAMEGMALEQQRVVQERDLLLERTAALQAELERISVALAESHGHGKRLRDEVVHLEGERSKLMTTIGIQARRAERLQDDIAELRHRLAEFQSVSSRPGSRAESLMTSHTDAAQHMNGIDENEAAILREKRQRLQQHMRVQARAFERLVNRLSSFRVKLQENDHADGAGAFVVPPAPPSRTSAGPDRQLDLR